MSRKELVLTLLAALLVFTLATCAVQSVMGASGETSGPFTSANTTGFRLDQQRAAFRSAVAVADGVTFAATMALTEFGVNGRQNLAVSPRFSVAGQSCTVVLVTVFKDALGTNYVLGTTVPVSFTASSFTDGAGKFLAPVVTFNAGGASHARIVVTTAPAAGNVDLWVGSY